MTHRANSAEVAFGLPAKKVEAAMVSSSWRWTASFNVEAIACEPCWKLVSVLLASLFATACAPSTEAALPARTQTTAAVAHMPLRRLPRPAVPSATVACPGSVTCPATCPGSVAPEDSAAPGADSADPAGSIPRSGTDSACGPGACWPGPVLVWGVASSDMAIWFVQAGSVQTGVVRRWFAQRMRACALGKD